MDKMVVLKLDGSIWECSPGWVNDENSVGCVTPIPEDSILSCDKAALAKGITHRQGMYGGVPCHEVREISS